MLSVVKLPEEIREFFRKQGKIGAAKRMTDITPERRSEIAKIAARSRWSKVEKKTAKTKQPKQTRGGK